LYLNKILILNDIGEYEKGIYEFEKFKYLNFNGDPEILLQISLLYKKLGNFKTSLTYVDKAIKVKDLPIFIYDKLFKLQGVLYAMDDNWESAYSSFLKMNDKNQSQELIKIIESNNTIKYKNPKTAMFLSIVPGAGYYYTGNNQTALSSLLVNGLLVYATTSNIKNDNIGMSLLTGVFSLSFYISNIQGAFKSAKNFNSRKRNLIKSKLNSKL
jgi:tetratricopeptide (TPR) repeat protein